MRDSDYFIQCRKMEQVSSTVMRTRVRSRSDKESTRDRSYGVYDEGKVKYDRE